MKNLFEQSRSHWVRYDRYELKTAADGKRYITPGKNAKPDIYNPLKEAPGIVLDALNVGMLMMARPGLRFPDGRSQSLPLRRCALRPMVYRQLPFLKFWEKYNRAYLMEGEDLSAPVEIEFCTGSFSAVRTAEFKAVGGFDEHYFMYVEDADLTQKMRTTGKAYLVPQYTAIHAWHRAAHRSLKPFLWQTGSLLRYFHKWGFKF